MYTLKKEKEYAPVLLINFVGLCLLLSRDEIFFWSRSGNDFKKLLLQPVSRLNKLSVPATPISKRQHGLDESVYDSQIDLYKHFIEACGKMSLGQVRFWLKEKPHNLMLSLLQKGEFEFLAAVEGEAHIPAFPGERTVSTFRSKVFRQDQNRLYDAQERLESKYPDTEAAEVSCFTASCALEGDEMISCAGGPEAVAAVAFTPQQIRYLASKQRRTREKGLLSYDASNVFAVVGKNKMLYMVSLRWSTTLRGDDQIGRWHYWVLETKHRFRPLSRLFVRC